VSKRAPYVLLSLLVGCILLAVAFSLSVGKSFQPPVAMDFLLRDNNPPAFHVTNLSKLHAGDCGQPLLRYGLYGESLIFFQLDSRDALVLAYSIIALEQDLSVTVYFNGDEVARHEKLPARTLSEAPVSGALALAGRKGGNILLFIYERGGNTTPAAGRVAFTRLDVVSRR